VRTAQVHPEVREVADALVAALGDDLRALLWHGSFARGEAGPDSDHDLIVVLRRIDDGVLLRMRDVFQGRRSWSTFVQSEEELRQYRPDGRLQFHYGYVSLYGEFEPPPWTRESGLADLRTLAAEIRFQCRFRILHKSAGTVADDAATRRFERRRDLRMLHYAAKWALMAMKARELLEGRTYPETRAELRGRLSNPEDLALVDIVERWAELEPGFAADITPLALQLDAFARRLVAALPEDDL
jgi:hypothetical protein